MRTIKRLLILLMVSSCASVQVEYDYDRAVDFSTYKTYNYYSDLETGLSELDTRRLLKSFDEAMSLKGLSLSSEPDFFINISSNEYDSPNRNSVGIGVGGSGRNVGGGVSVGIPMQSRYYRQIQFDFIDEDGRGLFWQAISESSYNPEANPEQREMNLKQIIDKVLKSYPPPKR
ncbi:MAG: DUF4136 domain-containing protein [Flavobacteriaceae bacterium]|nr:DUF4136 domain-containing protein [Bacteroidia bacterium]MBT8287198.1 DUF4136 domain-containing protein [Bacteroidia bacterium]NNF75556.1 DUF4136 domain-containing protein [Flavobacteriaceae bacterium]NNK73919.1 DUF4136 domain-containing protein [Flavobacteriaceae bacterium]